MPIVKVGKVDCSLYTRRIGVEDDVPKKYEILAYALVEYNYIMETLAKTFIIPDQQSRFIQVKTFNNVPFVGESQLH